MYVEILTLILCTEDPSKYITNTLIGLVCLKTFFYHVHYIFSYQGFLEEENQNTKMPVVAQDESSMSFSIGKTKVNRTNSHNQLNLQTLHYDLVLD